MVINHTDLEHLTWFSLGGVVKGTTTTELTSSVLSYGESILSIEYVN